MNKPGNVLTAARILQLTRVSVIMKPSTFEGLTGTTPHQYLLRTRLRRAAIRLRSERAKILDVALDSGFGDVSNFNRALRAEFGASPRAYRSAGQF
jgi:AraC family transcriptional regulator